MVRMAGRTTPQGHRYAATMETGFRCQHITMGTTGEVLQAGDEVADGSVAVSPADQFAKTAGGGLNWVGHDIHLEKRERERGASLQVGVYKSYLSTFTILVPKNA